MLFDRLQSRLFYVNANIFCKKLDIKTNFIPCASGKDVLYRGMSYFETIQMDLEFTTGKRDLPEGMSLGEVLGRLDESANNPDLPTQFVHYLERRSYVKALAWLKNPEMGHVR